MSTNVQASSSSYGLAVTTLVCSLQLWPSITTAKHRAWHLSCNTTTPPSGTWTTGGASTLDQLQNGDRCRRHIRWKCDWIQRCTIFAFLPSILDGDQVWRVWLGGRFPYYDLVLSAMYMLNKGIMRWRQWPQFRSRGDLWFGHFGLTQLITVSVHIPFDVGTISAGNIEGSCFRYQIVFICSQLTEYVQMISAISAFKAVAFPMPYKYDTVSQPVRACTMCTAGKYLAMLFLLQCYLANVYDCSPRTWTLHADIHSHIFFEVEINQQDKYIRIVAGHFDVRVTTCTWCNLN